MHVKCQASVSEFFLLVPIFCINYIHVHVLCRFWCYTCIMPYTIGRFTYLFPCVHLSFRVFFCILHIFHISGWFSILCCFFFIFDNHYSTVSFWTFWFFFLISIVFSFSWSKLPKFITYIRYMFSLHF